MYLVIFKGYMIFLIVFFIPSLLYAKKCDVSIRSKKKIIKYLNFIFDYYFYFYIYIHYFYFSI